MSRVIFTTDEMDMETFEMEKDYFNEFFKEMIKAYEQKHRTTVAQIIMAGTVGTWRGNFIGGKTQSVDCPLSMDVDSIDVEVEDNQALLVKGYHHDGTHLMHFYFLTESRLKKLGCYDSYNCGYWIPEDFEQIIENCKPLKLPKKNNYYKV